MSSFFSFFSLAKIRRIIFLKKRTQSHLGLDGLADAGKALGLAALLPGVSCLLRGLQGLAVGGREDLGGLGVRRLGLEGLAGGKRGLAVALAVLLVRGLDLDRLAGLGG